MIRKRWPWLWSTSAVAFSPGLVALVLVAVLSRRGWVGEWQWTLDWSVGSTTLLGPGAASLAAFDAQRYLGRPWRRHGGALVRGWAVPLQLAAAVWLWASAAWSVGIVAAVGMSWAAGAQGSAEVWTAPVGLVVLLGYVGVGLLIGALLPSVAAAPVAALVTYLLPVLTAALGLPQLLTYGYATGTLVGLDYRPLPTILVALANGALGVACLAGVVTVVTGRLAGRRWTEVAVGLVLLCAATTVAMTQVGPNRFTPAESVPYRCSGSSPEICLATETSVQLRAVAAMVSPMADTLEDAGVELPSRYTQAVPAGRIDEGGVIGLPDGTLNAGPPDPWSVALSLARPADCDAYHGESAPEAALEAQSLIAEVLLIEGGLTPAPTGDDARALWLRTPGAERDGWLRETMSALTSCSVDQINAPFAR